MYLCHEADPGLPGFNTLFKDNHVLAVGVNVYLVLVSSRQPYYVTIKLHGLSVSYF